MKLRILAAFAVAAAVALSGCTWDDSYNQKRLWLHLAYADPDTTLDDTVNWFASSVHEVSRGKLTIFVDTGCCGRAADNEVTLVRQVASGTSALGWVPTRAFDNLGVRSVSALTAPMLIHSYALEQAVLESDTTTPMLAGVGAAGVTGIAVEPGFLRKPIATHAEGPMRRVGDWAGKNFFAIESKQNASSIAALGATAPSLSVPARDTALEHGALQGLENSINFVSNSDGFDDVYITSNVTFWPRTTMLIANPKALRGLTETQRGWLRRAAGDVQQRVMDLAALDAAAIRSACAKGVTFVNANQADLDGFRQAFAPVFATLETDAVSKRAVEAIRKLDARTPPDPVLALPSCTK